MWTQCMSVTDGRTDRQTELRRTVKTLEVRKQGRDVQYIARYTVTCYRVKTTSRLQFRNGFIVHFNKLFSNSANTQNFIRR